jgi:hypothetical protein
MCHFGKKILKKPKAHIYFGTEGVASKVFLCLDIKGHVFKPGMILALYLLLL